jgi:hypothetical protein
LLALLARFKDRNPVCYERKIVMATFRWNRLSFLCTAILVTLVVGCLSSSATASLVNNLMVFNSTGSGTTYTVQTNGFSVGALMYSDRSYTLATVPSIVNGQTFIKTTNADKGVLPGNPTFMTFTLGQSAKVYVAHDSHIPLRPTWLTANFMDTGVAVTSQQTSLASFELFVNSYPSGAMVTLGSNIPVGGNTSNSMYTVIVVPTATDTTAPTVPSTLQNTCDRAIVVGLNWNKSTDAVGVAGYRIVRGGTVIGTVSGTVPDATLYYADTTVAASTAYSYVVKAFDGAGNSSSSAALPVTTPAVSGTGDAPYCQSTKVASMAFNFNGFTEDTAVGPDNPPYTDGSDLWTNTWAPDGNTYAFFGDGWGLCGQLETAAMQNADKTSFGIAKLTGRSNVANGQCSSTFSNVYGGYNSSHPYTVNQLQGKANSIISIGSNFYAIGNVFGTGSSQYGGANHYEIESSLGSAFNWQSNSANWQFCAGTSTGPTLGSYCPTRIVQYGKGVANPDGYVYMTGIANTADFWCDSGCPAFVPPAKTFMSRVLVAQILTQASYQYYAGLDLNGAPIWTTDVARMQPIFSNRNANKTDSHGVVWVMATGLGEPVYNPALGRYIATSTAALGQTSFYDSPNPWGPWTVMQYNNFNVAVEDSANKPTGGWGNFGAASNGLGVNGVPAWTSVDGKTVYFLFSGTQNASTATSFTFLQGKNLDVFSYVNATITTH